MNKVRNVAIGFGVVVVFIVCFFVVSVLTEKPQKVIDCTFATQSGGITDIKTVARDGGAVLIFIDPEVEGSVDVLEKVIKHKGDANIIAVSVSKLDAKEQLELLPKKVRELEYLVLDGKEIAKTYNIGNPPITYFVDSEFWVKDVFVGNISDKSVKKTIEKITK